MVFGDNVQSITGNRGRRNDGRQERKDLVMDILYEKKFEETSKKNRRNEEKAHNPATTKHINNRNMSFRNVTVLWK